MSQIVITPSPTSWTDYTNNSQLDLVFGQISAEVIDLSVGAGTKWGIITHPYSAQVLAGTRDEAKIWAETILRNWLMTSLIALPTTAPSAKEK